MSRLNFPILPRVRSETLDCEIDKYITAGFSNFEFIFSFCNLLELL